MVERAGGLTRNQVDTYSSDLVGIVRKTFNRLHDVADLHTISVGAYTARAAPLIGSRTPRNSGGDAATQHSASAAAIGEALERYSACWIEPSRLVTGTERNLADGGASVLPTEALRIFTDEQLAEDGFGLTQPGPDTTMPWIESGEVLSGRRVLIPAQLAYLTEIPGAPRIHTSTSNGLAFGTEPYAALLSGILELVERDAFMLTWYHQLTLPRIDTNSHPSLESFVRRHVAPTGLQVSAIDLSVFTGVPAVLAVARPAVGGHGPIGVGASAALRPEVACIKAMSEAVGSRSWAAQRVRSGSPCLVDSNWFESIVDFEHHIDLFSDPAMYEYLDFLDASQEHRAVADIQGVLAPAGLASVEALAIRLAERGVTIYSVDVTSPDVREAGGFVIRAFSPEMQPLDVSYRYRYLGHPRLRDAAVLAAAGEPLRGVSSLNHIPHPFP